MLCFILEVYVNVSKLFFALDSLIGCQIPFLCELDVIKTHSEKGVFRIRRKMDELDKYRANGHSQATPAELFGSQKLIELVSGSRDVVGAQQDIRRIFLTSKASAFSFASAAE